MTETLMNFRDFYWANREAFRMAAAGAVFGPVGYELNLLYIAALLALVLGGPSPLSVDRWLEEEGKRLVNEGHYRVIGGANRRGEEPW